MFYPYTFWDLRPIDVGTCGYGTMDGKPQMKVVVFLLTMSMTIYTNTKPVTFNARTASTVWKKLFLGVLVALFRDCRYGQRIRIAGFRSRKRLS